MDRMMEQLVDSFNDMMSNRAVAIMVMISAAVGAVVTIAGGYYCTYLLITALSNS